MKTRACRTGWKAGVTALIVTLSLGAGAALADGEPSDPEDVVPDVPLMCPTDPESDLPCCEWIQIGDGGLAAVVVQALVTIAAL